MKYSVALTPEAEGDLLDSFRHVAITESLERADRLLDRLEGVCQSLESIPARGHVPAELERLGMLDFREILAAPYRLLYEIEDDAVAIHAILDGRRDMQELLERRLLRE